MSQSRFNKNKFSNRAYLPLTNTSNKNKNTLIWSFGLGWSIAIFALVWGVLFVNDFVTLGGVPAEVIGRFLQDPGAIIHFLTGNKQALHQNLEELGIEEQIKDYYRDRIPDEIQLDHYIHQLLYNWTGYVGDNYIVGSQGILFLKTTGEIRLKQEIKEKPNNIFPLN